MYIVRSLLVFSLIMVYVDVVKGSCYQFGHACYGAHGKRSDFNPEVSVDIPADITGAYVPNEEANYPSLPGINDAKYKAMQNYLRNWILQLKKGLRQIKDSPDLNISNKDYETIPY